MTKEWGARVKLWIEELPNHFTTPLASVLFEGFRTFARMTPAEASASKFEPMPPGTSWGQMWEYAWFRTQLTLPKESEGGRVILSPRLGGESLVFANGVAVGAIDKQHHYVEIARTARGGALFEILIEAYGGHGPRVENARPLPPGEQSVPLPPGDQSVVGESLIALWNESAYQLWIDASTLYLTYASLDERSLRAQQIAEGLQQFTIVADFELADALRFESFSRAREVLAPLLECVNGSTAPTMYAFGQSHLDLAWLWPWEETRRKSARTLATQLGLMDQYPEYRFFMSQAPLFRVLQQDYPAVYERLKEKVSNGQIVPEGGLWLEADTNLPSGESLIRQLLYGRRFFKEELGVESVLAWLPDVFGFTAALPQILVGCGIQYFASQKINRFYNGGEPFPYNTFWWEGIDGTRILTHLFVKHNSRIDPQTVIARWENDRNQSQGIDSMLFPFGFGDGGGGATRDHLEYARRLRDLEGAPRVRMGHPLDFFGKIESEGRIDNVYVGELYFQAHRGTYTSQAKTKRGNRKGELALRAAELWAAVAARQGSLEYPRRALEAVWERLLFNQFHDILPGSSIHRVHEEAERDLRRVERVAKRIAHRAAGRIAVGSEGITLFNSLSWPREALIELPEGASSAVDFAGKAVPVQSDGERNFAEVHVPSCGWTTIYPASAIGSTREEGVLRATPNRIENDLVRLEIATNGEISSILDKSTNRELAAANCNVFRLYKDVTTVYDAWDIDSMYPLAPVTLPPAEDCRVTVLSTGPLVARLRVEKRISNSSITQVISLERHARQVDFVTTLDWRETHKLLKVSFPTEMHVNEALHEIQYGYVRRPTHLSRQYDQDRFEVWAHRWTALAEANRGCALLNDSKYGVSVRDGDVQLTLLKAATAPDMTADRGIQQFTYSFYFWNGPLTESAIPNAAMELNEPVRQEVGAGGEASLFGVDGNTVLIDCVKAAEDSSGDLILRLYEWAGATASARLSSALAFREAWECSMLEERAARLATDRRDVYLDFRPFEIKTIRLT